jgi:hypothetical protein
MSPLDIVVLLKNIFDWREPLKDGLILLIMLHAEKLMNAFFDVCYGYKEDSVNWMIF